MSKSFFSANVRYRQEGESYRASFKRRDAEQAILKRHKFETRYFPFDTDSSLGKRKARADCEAFARHWSRLTGVPLVVVRT